MTKLQKAVEALKAFLTSHDGDWTIDAIWREIGDFDDMLPHMLRRAAHRLPEGCLTRKGRKLILHARHFASTTEIIAALKALPNWEDDLPVLLKRHYPTLRETLVLATDWALHQSLEWASRGNFELGYYSYGQYVRWGKAA